MDSRGIFVAALALSVLLAAAGCGTQPTTPAQPLRIGISPIPDSAAFAIGSAKDRSNPPYELASFPSDSASLEAMLRGELDLATASEAPILHALATGESLRILATLALNDEMVSIVGDRAQGVERLQDLTGKQVAATAGSNAPFALRTSLAFHDISLDQVRTLPLDQEAAIVALEAGEVAAAVLWSPFRERAMARLGERALTFNDGAAYVATWNLVARRDADIDPRTLDALLRDLITHSRTAAKADSTTLTTTADFCSITPEEAKRRLSHIEFGPRLDQSLLVLFEHQAVSTVPDMPLERILHALDPHPLAKIDPARCTVIR